jgi:hypothetical protein
VNLVETLGVEIGVRQAGTAQAAESAEAIADAFRELGLEPRFQEFPFLAYDADEPTLEIDGEEWSAAPCLYAHPTEAAGIKGRLHYLGVQVVVADLFEAPTWAIEGEDGADLGRILANPLGGGAVPFGSGYGYALTPPSAFVSTADGERLREHEGAHVRLVVRGAFRPGARDRNVIAELAGESAEAILVSAHFDSVWRGPGTVDNATGVEGVRRVAERLAGRKLERSVVFVGFAAEEIGCAGSRYYVIEAKTRGELDRIVGVVNLDCIAHGDQLQIWASPDELRGRALELARVSGLDRRYDLLARAAGPGTDHFFFAQEEIPAASILYLPYPEYHLPDERMELVDEQKLADAVDLAVALVESQLTRPVARPG